MWADDLAAGFAAWGHADLDYGTRVTKGWAMTRLDHALLAVAAYLVLVAVGVARRPANWRTLSESSGANKPKSIGEVLTQGDPVRIAQLIYNITQV